MISLDEQINGNVLIAKYLNWQLDLSFPDKGKVWRSPNGYVELDSTMKFHSDWNLLIPICEKIKMKIITDKELMWKAIVDYITRNNGEEEGAGG